MGIFNITIQIGNLNGEHFENVEVMVDTGAITTAIPRSTLEGLGIRPTRQETFEYAGGERVRLDMAQANAMVEGIETVTWVIFGEDGMSHCWATIRWRGCFLRLTLTTSG